MSEDVGAVDDRVITRLEASRFLTQATFGARDEDVEGLTGSSLSAWFINQLDIPPSYVTPVMSTLRAQRRADIDGPGPLLDHSAEIAFWRNSIDGPDQLRQRMAFALSQILVVSEAGLGLPAFPEALGYFQDLLIAEAFGNYRDLLEQVTYSPAMATYLTYLGSEKADPETGRMPDENYARELLQLFTVGLTALNTDGTPLTTDEGQPVALFDNTDIAELAAVFTGFKLQRPATDPAFAPVVDGRAATRLAAYQQPLRIDRLRHESRELFFLGRSVPAAGNPAERVSMALDIIFEHSNVGPFLAKQLIQRFVTSNPSPGYVQRVSAAFDAGEFVLPDGQWVGDGRRGDLAATLAAVLFDREARSESVENGGKIREPVLRFTHWARAFNVPVTPEYQPRLWDVGGADELNQHPYNAPSVFNFFRPGFVVPSSFSSRLGLVAPELQLANSSSIPGYASFMSGFIFASEDIEAASALAARLRETGLKGATAEVVAASFVPDYREEQRFAIDPEALVDHLSNKLVCGALSVQQKTLIVDALRQAPQLSLDLRVKAAVLMVMTSPDYLLQR